MFKNIFFSAAFSTNLNDIENSFYSSAVECSTSITESEVIMIISRIALDKTSNLDDIINRLIKTCSSVLIKLLISLFQICITHAYHLITLKTVNTITLKKTRKSDYITSKAYKSIALLNIIEKVMKSIMSKKISWLTKNHRLLFDSHMRVRSDRSIETTLKLLTKQIHTVWDQSTNKMITLLSLNVIETFDTMSHSRLIHNLRKRKISQRMINWVSSFLRDKSITFAINRRAIEQFAIQTSISQKSSIFSLLYLFYNADLLKICDKLDTNTRSLRYANDVNILTYDKSTKKNCRTLKRVHRLCEKWAARHEFVFVSIKYELIHFTRNSKKFNMIVILNIVNNIIESKTNIRVLELQIDTKLKWDSHVKKIQKKMIRQSMTLIKILASIWEIIFSKSRVVYIFVIRSIMIYVSSI
jgi:hypothetical protein